MTTQPAPLTEGSAAHFGFAIKGVRIGDGEMLDLPGAGSVIAVVGANNSGKSTFLRQLQEILTWHGLTKEMTPRVLTEIVEPWVGSADDLTAWLMANAQIDEHTVHRNVTRNGRHLRGSTAIVTIRTDRTAASRWATSQ